MRAMIMAAGLGTRLMPLTGLTPKPMVPILGVPALAHILDLLRRYGIGDVVINLHHQPNVITSYFGDGADEGMHIRYSYEPELLGTAGGVKKNEDFLTREGTFLVLSGDSLMDADLAAVVAAHRASGYSATLVLKEVPDPSQYGVVSVSPEGQVEVFQEKPAPGDELSCLCNCGLYVLEPEVMQRVPAAQNYDFGRQLWPQMLKEGARLGTHVLEGYWNDIGDLEAYRRGSYDALEGRVRLERRAVERRPGIWAGPRSRIDDGAQLDPPIYLGAECCVEAGSRLVGPIILGDHCVVEEGVNLSRVVAWSDVMFGRGVRLSECLIARASRFHGWVDARNCVVGERCLLGELGPVSDLELESGSVLWG